MHSTSTSHTSFVAITKCQVFYRLLLLRLPLDLARERPRLVLPGTSSDPSVLEDDEAWSLSSSIIAAFLDGNSTALESFAGDAPNESERRGGGAVASSSAHSPPQVLRTPGRCGLSALTGGRLHPLSPRPLGPPRAAGPLDRRSRR